MNEYPLLYTFREVVEGPGFVAGVICNGRAVMADEGADGWHLSGVEPGALSELGSGPHEAYFHFRHAFSDSLRVLAEDASSFEEFHASAEAFFARRDEEETQRWEWARAAIRAGADCDAPFKELPRETAEEPRGLVVIRLDKPQQADIPKAARQIAGQEQVVVATPLRPAA